MPGQREPPPREPQPQLDNPGAHNRRGDEHLRAGRYLEAIEDFDVYLAAHPEAEPHHWQRGIAYYYAGQFEEGVAQFELHRSVNPADVENATWHFLCKARATDLETARAGLLPVGTDRRRPMGTVYELYAGQAEPEDVLASAGDSRSALFYGHLYLGLYFEAAGDLERARKHVELAATTYGFDHYMGDVARVHLTSLSR